MTATSARLKNTGKAAQEEFDERFVRLGKNAFVYEFEDQAALTGLNDKAVRSRAKPADRVVIVNGRTFFAEIKSTHSKTGFAFSMLRPTQVGFAKMVTAAGGDYRVYVKNMTTGEWFQIPWLTIASTRQKSLSWARLKEAYTWLS